MNPFNVAETISYTVINPENPELENKIVIEVNNIDEMFTVNNIPIDPQQMAELGTLFLALAAKTGFEVDSCLELLDGFELPVPKQLKEFYEN